MSLKVGALFAGYGGIELAVSSVLDTELAWYADCCKSASHGTTSSKPSETASCRNSAPPPSEPSSTTPPRSVRHD